MSDFPIGRCQFQDAAHIVTVLRSYGRQAPSARKQFPERPTPLQASIKIPGVDVGGEPDGHLALREQPIF